MKLVGFGEERKLLLPELIIRRENGKEKRTEVKRDKDRRSNPH